MKHSLEPPRLLWDKGADPIARQLLRAGYGDGPTEQRLRAAPAAIAALLGTHAISSSALGSVAAASIPNASVGAGTTSAASTTAATLSASAGTTTGVMAALPLFAKSMVVGLAVGGSLVATVLSVSPGKHSHAQRPVPAVSAQPLTLARTTTLAPAVPVAVADASQNAQEEALQSQPSRMASEGTETEPPGFKSSRVAPPRRVPLQGSSTEDTASGHDTGSSSASPVQLARSNLGDVGSEVRLLDSARNALEGGDPSLALRELEYHSELTHKTLEPEATVLRVRALLAAHRNQEAARLARSFAFAAPNAPQNLVLRRMLEDVNSSDPK